MQHSDQYLSESATLEIYDKRSSETYIEKINQKDGTPKVTHKTYTNAIQN